MPKVEDCFLMTKKMSDAIFKHETYDSCFNSFTDKKDKNTLRSSMIASALALGEPNADIRDVYIKFRSDVFGIAPGRCGLSN